jgi:hypothetical protein
MMMSVEQSVEWLERETEEVGGNFPQCRFIYHKYHMTRLGFETRAAAVRNQGLTA